MTESKKRAVSGVDRRAELYTEASRRVWEYAETAFREYRSAALQEEILEHEGFAVVRGVADIETAFTASWGSGSPKIGYLGEYDALSGVGQEAGCTVHRPVGISGHGCGHNMLGMASLAAAVAVKDYLEETGTPGTVMYFGCPGEEGGSGKAFMARDGVFDGLDAAICWHPGEANGIKSGSSLANYQVLYRFTGKAAHAAGQPHLGRSALDAVELMNVGVQFLREHIPTTARIHYAVTDTGGYSPNVVQANASVLYLMRMTQVDELPALYERVNDIARGAALMTGTQVEIDFVKGCSNTMINTAFDRLLYANLQEQELPSYTEAEMSYARDLRAAANPDACYTPEDLPLSTVLNPFNSTDAPGNGSTDVSDVSWQCPTGQISAVCWPKGLPGHSWFVTSAGATSIADKGMLYAAKVMGGAGIDLFADPSLLGPLKEEFCMRLAGRTYPCPIPKGVRPRPIDAVR